ncbi:hypothetical protein [Aquidulcibacter sp.]|uniref:hypothetical protein n=1 Tax=Aquidulcibacter sp. TaxID=2052990 RepID=UPI0025BF399D|nr:hypothetical protein [Aquidulcibacter sp.]MCA3695304.1 hypothetical protein [Aquidulcibacter sp.]
MATLDFLVAKGNEGAGIEKLAGYTTPGGIFIPASALIDALGNEISRENYLPAAATQRIVEAGFSDVSATDIVDPVFSVANGGSVKVTGSMADSQAGGSAIIVTGTTANSEFLARSGPTFKGAVRVRSHQILSQRIANANFMTLLADLQGEDLAYTINNSTSVTVTQTGHTLTAANVGQFMFLGALSSVGIPGRYAIASVVAGVSITFTVAGWPGAGTGFLTLFGRNHVRVLLDGASQTSGSWNNQRNGWEAGATSTTVSTTATPGAILVLDTTGTDVNYLDGVLSATSTPNLSMRSSRSHALPPPDLPLYLFLWAYNGSTAPASSTTWTIGHARVEENAMQSVYLQGVRQQGSNNPLPVNVLNAPQVSLGSATGRIGFTAASGINWDDSSTVLAANATFTGTSRDLAAVAASTAFNSATTFAQEFRISAESDQTGTLWVEASRDNATWRRVKSVTTAAVAGGGFSAEIVHRPSWRYVRGGFTNGATLQTRFTLGSIAMAA